MIGYVNIYPSELKVKELAKYRAYYCGLCRLLCKHFSEPARLALSYDFTFLLILHASLYGARNYKFYYSCPVHPISGTLALINEYTSYSADMNLYMVYKKIQDDVLDNGGLFSMTMERLLRSKGKRLKRQYPDKTLKIDSLQEKLNEKEAENNKDLETLSSVFGEILSEIFVIKEDLWSSYLGKIGYFLGKFIYILDAYEDMERDIKKENFNPLLNEENKLIYKEEEIKEWLTVNIASACVEFEKLPCVNDYNILHNILYFGVWNKYNLIRQKRLRKQSHEQRPL